MRAISIAAIFAMAIGIARAQDAQTQRARDLFQQGMTALADQRAADAIGPFRRSLSLSARVPTAYNLALALQANGQFVEAEHMLGELEDGRYGELDPLTRDHVRAHRTELAPRIATLVVNSTADVEVEIDDRDVGRASPGSPLERTLDPGSHVVRGIRGDGATVERSISLAEGERAELVLPVRIEPPAGDREEIPVATSSIDGGLVALFVTIGVLAAAGAAIGIAVAAAPGYEIDPVWGNTFALSL